MADFPPLEEPAIHNPRLKIIGICCSQISLELVQSGKRELPSRPDGAKEVIQSAPECSDEEVQPVSGSNAREEVDSRAQQKTSPIHFKEKDLTTRGK
jgi:hypothetical protein